MEIKEIVKELEYYNEELPKEALEKAIEYKEEMIPELLNMLEYTKENLENIFNEKDEFYGYIYAFFLLAEFREKRAFPYLIDIINKGEDYDPHPIDLSDVEISDDLIELREAIAENAHDIWARARMDEGWTYGPVRNDAKKQHPDLVPYSRLPDSEKDYDRIMAMNTLRLVRRLGYDIVK